MLKEGIKEGFPSGWMKKDGRKMDFHLEGRKKTEERRISVWKDKKDGRKDGIPSFSSVFLFPSRRNSVFSSVFLFPSRRKSLQKDLKRRKFLSFCFPSFSMIP